MPTEIERKFLVCGDFRNDATEETEIVQGYLSRVPMRTVRVRIRGDKGFITIKGQAEGQGTTRFEWEKEISVEDAKELLDLCEPYPVIKTRYLVPVRSHVFEVDVFHGDNDGLILAEIELDSADEEFDKPDWLGEEVTGTQKYYNSFLSINPFRNW